MKELQSSAQLAVAEWAGVGQAYVQQVAAREEEIMYQGGACVPDQWAESLRGRIGAATNALPG